MESPTRHWFPLQAVNTGLIVALVLVWRSAEVPTAGSVVSSDACVCVRVHALAAVTMPASHSPLSSIDS